jgi:lysophospholipase L1-like esterase
MAGTALSGRGSAGAVWLAFLLAGASSAQSVAELQEQVAGYRRLLADWAGLTRYGSENAELRAPKPGENRIVFLGDEITENWPEALFFRGKPYLNRGIARQITPQMLVRFRQDVILLKPKAVVIHAGANDIASIMGPGTQGMIAENIMSMVDLARANGIRVVLASALPVSDAFAVPQTARRPIGKIIGLNGWLHDYARESDSVYLDYYSAMVENRALKKELTTDGFLPNDAGYAVMAPMAERAIAEALASR